VSDDNELLARIRAGAINEFAELVRRHQHQVCAILHHYERDPQRLEELAQDTFVKAWRALDRFEIGRAPFQHWLSRIAVRVALDHLRQRRRRAEEVSWPISAAMRLTGCAATMNRSGARCGRRRTSLTTSCKSCRRRNSSSSL